MWNWLRSPKNLAVITALASAIGFAWTKLTHEKDVPAPPPTSLPSPININIDAKQTNAQSVSPTAVTLPVPEVSTQSLGTEKVPSSSPIQRLPVRRQLANGVPNEVLPGFWLTLEGYEGTPNNLTAHLVSPSWGNRDLSFKIGGAPFDFSHGGNTYQLVIEAMKDERVHILIRQ